MIALLWSLFNLGMVVGLVTAPVWGTKAVLCRVPFFVQEGGPDVWQQVRPHMYKVSVFSGFVAVALLVQMMLAPSGPDVCASFPHPDLSLLTLCAERW